MTDFSTYKFRCSGLSNLMVSSRKKSDPVSETTKAYLRDIYIKEVFGRDRGYKTINKFTLKGTMVESDSLDLVEKATGKKYFKNLENFENDWIKGTPDIIEDELVRDIKSSWDLWTYAGVDEKKARQNYYYQLLGYMWLTGKKKGDLLYCLADTPEMLINDEIYRLSFKMPEEEAEKYRHNFKFDDIPAELRVKSFPFDFDELEVESLKEAIVNARAYLCSIERL